MKRTHGSTSLCTSLLIACLATTLPLTGCSFIFVQPPHEEYGYRGTAGCTTAPVAPVIDTIFVLTNVGSAMYVASEDNVANKGQAIGVGMAVAALWLSSAVYGYYNTSRCSELQQEADDGPYRGPVRTAPRGWRPPPAPRPAPPPPQYAVPPAPGAPASAGPPPAGAAPDPSTGAPPTQVAPQPSRPVVPQQLDDDDPASRRTNAPAAPRLPE